MVWRVPTMRWEGVTVSEQRQNFIATIWMVCTTSGNWPKRSGTLGEPAKRILFHSRKGAFGKLQNIPLASVEQSLLSDLEVACYCTIA